MLLDFTGVMPATVTPFTDTGEVDHEALFRLGQWLSGVPGVTGLVCNGHAGEGTSLSYSERSDVVETLKRASGGKVPVISGVMDEGTDLVAKEAMRAENAGADGILVYPAHGWLRFGFQKPAPVDRYKSISDAVSIPQILFLYPDSTKATYDVSTILEICKSSNVVAIKNGVRNMARWDQEVPFLRANLPEVKILTCQDEYLLHTMWDSDGSIVGYGCLVPELMVELQNLAHEGSYREAKAVYDRIAPLTKAIYHRDNHLEGTVALKIGLVLRGVLESASVRSPLFDLDEADHKAIAGALAFAGLSVNESTNPLSELSKNIEMESGN